MISDSLLASIAGVLAGIASLIPSNAVGVESLSCDESGVESRHLRGAPHGARRVDAHRLRVRLARGSADFVDQGGDEPLDGLKWHYCGYLPSVGFHLIGRMEMDVFGGVLLADADGQRLAGGHTVLFSPDGKYYLAIEQHDGKFLADWSVHDRHGALQWQGDSGLLNPAERALVGAVFESPRWTDRDELLVSVSCDGKGPPQAGRLVRDGAAWHWRFDAACATAGD